MQIQFFDKNGKLYKITESTSDERNKKGHILVEDNKRYELIEYDYNSKAKYKKYKEL